jgi:carbon monoxide dehydrogenase subunit G
VQLEHSFTVPVGIDEAWRVLLDIERVAPCMPGASLETVDGDEFTGSVKVKLGPINLTYKGKASFVEKDEAAHRATIDARGRDARGNGTAAAKVTATLREAGDATEVSVTTDLDITGKPAQFGRGVMVDVGNKLIGQFADCLAGKLAGGADAEAPGPTPDAAPTADPAAPTKAAAEGASLRGETADGGSDAAVADSVPADAAGSGASEAATSEPPSAAATGAATAGGGVRRIPPTEVEPINLIESAGPALAKRLAPVAAAVLLLLVLVLRRRGRRG